MGEAIGQILPFAVGVGLSPVPIIAVVVMLSTPRARANGPAFLLGWLVGLTVVGTIVFLISGAVGASDDAEPATWAERAEPRARAAPAAARREAVARAGRAATSRRRSRSGWARSTRSRRPRRAGAGVVLSAANPKNLVLAIGAAAAIAETGISVGQEIVAYAIFVADRDDRRRGAGRSSTSRSASSAPADPRRPAHLDGPEQRA